MKFGVIFAVLAWCLVRGDAQLEEDCTVNRCTFNELCYNRFYSNESDYACQCINRNVGYDCSVNVFASSQQTCFGSSCINRAFASPNWPGNYLNQDTRVFLIFVPLAIRLTFTFDPNFAVEPNGDELYIGAGLTFDTDSDLNSASDPTKQVYFFEGTSSPDTFTLDGTDSAWMYWRTDDAGTLSGFRVTWQATLDTTPPTVDCPTDQTMYVDMGTPSARFVYEEPTATDEGVVVVRSQTHEPGDIFSSGRTYVVYTFQDAAGNVAPACVFFVYVIEDDMTPPVVDCPGDFTEYVTIGVTSVVVSYDEPTATDNGGSALLRDQSHAPGDTFPLGSTSVSYTFEDISGNIAPDCRFFVHVTDSLADIIPPMVACPADIARPVPQGVSFLPVSFQNATATDNSGTTSLVGVNPASGSSFPLGTTNVTYSFSDQSDNIGTCTFSVTIFVEDTTSPEVTCPADITLSVPQGMTSLTVTLPTATGTDNSGTASPVSVVPPSGSSFSLGTTEVTVTLADPSGNEGSCTFRVTITTSGTPDTTPPDVTCPADIARSVPQGVTSLAVTFPTATATDNSDMASLVRVTMPSGSSFPLGTTEVRFVFEDPTGNEGSCTFSVNVTTSGMPDTTPPSVTCPANIIRSVPQGVTSLVVVFQAATATDDSGTTALDGVDPPSGSSFPPGTTDVTYSFSDPSGNIGNCTFVVTITTLGPTGCGNSSCEYGGTCVTVGEDYVCECLPGFVGERCEIDINECSSLPCMNGGTCINGAGWFSCQCRQGYSGINCEIVGFCDLEGDWYNECNDRLSLSPTSTGLILGDYYSNDQLATGETNPSMVVGYINRKYCFSSFGFIVTRGNGKSTGSWSGQCQLCDGKEVLYTTWTNRLRVDTCADTRKATRVGQDKWTRYRQNQAPREA